MDAKLLRRQLEEFLDEEIRLKPEADRTGHEDLLLEAGQSLSEQLLRHYMNNPDPNASLKANVLRDLRETNALIDRNRNGLEG